mgnify:CR=1 FL=1
MYTFTNIRDTYMHMSDTYNMHIRDTYICILYIYAIQADII